MNVLLVFIPVILMQIAQTLVVVSPVPVTQDTVEMDSHVQVSVLYI